MSNRSDRVGVSIGGLFTALAVVISYTHLHSILRAFLHGMCGILYVLYFLICRPY